jgi:glycosyltransferase involved in cell wall biosynthesis
MHRSAPDQPATIYRSGRDGPADILLFVKGWGPGGVERIALRLAAGWRDAGVRVDLLVANNEAAPTPAIGYIPIPAWPLIGHRWNLARLAVAAMAAARGGRPAIIFCPGNAYTIIAIVLKIRLGRACPPILAKISNDLRRDDLPWWARAPYRLWLRVQGRLIDRFAALSQPMAQEVAERMAVPANRIHVVPNPVLSLRDLDPEVIARPNIGQGRRFVAIGRLERQKDYPLMLRAFARASAPDDRLVIYGEGGERRALVMLTEQLQLTQRVHFAGHCPDVRKRLADHDILLLTSAYEGQPGAIVEALSAGLAIIATRCCAGMAELLDGGALGQLVDRGAMDDLVRAIATARPDAQDRGAAQAKARAFTIEAAMPAYAALFATMAADRAARSAPSGEPRSLAA